MGGPVRAIPPWIKDMHRKRPDPKPRTTPTRAEKAERRRINRQKRREEAMEIAARWRAAQVAA